MNMHSEFKLMDATPRSHLGFVVINDEFIINAKFESQKTRSAFVVMIIIIIAAQKAVVVDYDDEEAEEEEDDEKVIDRKKHQQQNASIM